jgi:hypothetical protein
MKQAYVSPAERVPGEKDTVAINLPLATSIVASTRSGGTGTTGVTSAPLRSTGSTSVSPATSVTRPANKGVLAAGVGDVDAPPHPVVTMTAPASKIRVRSRMATFGYWCTRRQKNSSREVPPLRRRFTRIQ